MALTFEDAVQIVLKKLDPYQVFNDDVEILVAAIVTQLHSKSCIFADLIQELKTVAAYRKGNIGFDLPIEFNNRLLFKLPFAVNLVFVANEPRLFRLKTSTQHSFVRNGYVDAGIFRRLLIESLNNIISDMPIVKCPNGRNYQLYYCNSSKAPYVFIHYIVAREQSTPSERDEIVFSFSEALVFVTNEVAHPFYNNHEYWIAENVVHVDKTTWTPSAHVIKLLKINERINAKAVTRLLATIFLANLSPWENNTWGVKVSYIQTLTNLGINFVRLPAHLALVKVLECCIDSLNCKMDDAAPFYFKDASLRAYYQILNAAYNDLKSMQSNNAVSPHKLFLLFGLKH